MTDSLIPGKLAPLLRYFFLAAVPALLYLEFNSLFSPHKSSGMFWMGVGFLTCLFGFFHAVALSAAAILKKFLSEKVRSIVYLVASLAGLLITFFLQPPWAMGGMINIWTGFLASVALPAIDFFLAARRRGTV